MLQPKGTDWMNGYKNKTHIYALYKKPTSGLKTHICFPCPKDQSKSQGRAQGQGGRRKRRA